MSEDIHLHYTDIIIACVQLRQAVGDEFFIKILPPIESVFELISQVERLDVAERLQLLACRRLLLKDKLSILRDINSLARQKRAAQKKSMDTSAKPVKAKTTRFPERNKKVNELREQILGFIRDSREARTKDIVSQFHATSQRTILRNLKELVHQGLVVKQAEHNGASRYLVS